MINQMGKTYTIEDSVRPWTTNSERTWHYQKRAKVVKETRERWFYLAKEARVPRLKKIKVAVVPLAKDRRWKPDVAACYPAVKAAIDGLVDAGVIPDDNPTHLESITFFSVNVCGREGMRVIISELT